MGSEMCIRDRPKGVGSVIRVVFKADGDYDPETFYVEIAPGLWVEYDSDDVKEFTWQDMLQIIKYGEAEVFEVVYEGFGATERDDAFRPHIKDFIWREGL